MARWLVARFPGGEMTGYFIVPATLQTLKQKVLIDCEFAKLHKAPLCIFLQLFYVRDFAHILIMIRIL